MKKNYSILIIGILILLVFNLKAQEFAFDWGKRFGNCCDYYAEKSVIDDDGNIYLCAIFNGAFNYQNISLVPNVQADILVLKMSKTGQLLWANRVGGDTYYYDQPENIAIDKDGNCYVTGFVRGNVTFGSDTTIQTKGNSQDAFFCKYDANGNLQWAKVFGGKEDDMGKLVLTDSENEVYFIGTFSNDTIYFSENDSIIAPQYGSVFLTKFNQSGELIFSKVMANHLIWDHMNGQVDSDNNLYIIGSTFFSQEFDNLTITPANNDAFVIKYDKSGNALWLQQITGELDEVGRDLSLDGNGNIYITGVYNNDAVFGDFHLQRNESGNEYDSFIAKYDIDGNFKWAKQIGNDDENDEAFSVACSSKGEPFILGRFSDTLSYNYQELVSKGNYDLFLAKFDKNGNPIKCESFGGFDTSWAGDRAGSVCFDNTGALYIYGDFHGTMIFDNESLVSSGQSDIFMLRWNKCETDTILFVEDCYKYISPSQKYTWYQSGTYLDTLPNAAGCDSIIEIDLKIKNTSVTLTANDCDYYVSPNISYIWIESGTYTEIIPNSAGCDSIITIELTINHKSFASVSPTVCESYTSPSGRYTWTESGVYYDTIPNITGCDSIIAISLTVIMPSSSTIDATECSKYISPSGKYTWTESGTYFDTIPNILGCDSLITINLQVIQLDTSVNVTGNKLIANASDVDYQWYNCETNLAIADETNKEFTVESDGWYSVIINDGNCIDTSLCHFVKSVGLNPHNLNNLDIYPNPTYNFIDISLNSTEVKTIKIIDVIGHELKSVNVIDHLIQRVYLEGDKGFYFVKIIEKSGNSYLYKIIKK